MHACAYHGNRDEDVEGGHALSSLRFNLHVAVAHGRRCHDAMVESVAVGPPLDEFKRKSGEQIDRDDEQEGGEEVLGVVDRPVAGVGEISLAIAVNVEHLRREEPREEGAPHARDWPEERQADQAGDLGEDGCNADNDPETCERLGADSRRPIVAVPHRRHRHHTKVDGLNCSPSLNLHVHRAANPKVCSKRDDHGNPRPETSSTRALFSYIWFPDVIGFHPLQSPPCLGLLLARWLASARE